ncbi:short-chain dehydrogenase/reductase SDR [Scenedesmus sp. NREL 46B-D3]|nr:short-chain dehydrogenase/reductase SDR [Scenedesmus sp. NREL 46B-D3]
MNLHCAWLLLLLPQPHQPGVEADMAAKPIFIRDSYKGSGKLQGKVPSSQVAAACSGDSGIGRAVAVHFAREGADVAILYLDEHKDADEVVELVKKEGRRCLKFAGDASKPETAKEIVEKTVQEFGRLDILVNNASQQHMQTDFAKIDPQQLASTFAINVFGYFYMAQAALPHLKEGASIINTSSVTAYKGSPGLVDYSSTKGAQISFTRALSNQLVSKGIRVNAVAPGPIWTPLQPATFPGDKLEKLGDSVPMERPGQPCECAGCYVLLASEDGSYISGQTLHPNGGVVVSG